MIFTCIGHAKFLIELENGMRIVTDPMTKPAAIRSRRSLRT